MVRPNLADIPDTPFPDGYGIRSMRSGEGGVWTDIQRDAEPYYTVDDDLFVNQFGHDLRATRWRTFFVINERGAAAGTVSAWYDRDRDGEDYGLIHWIAIRPAYQGLGLGKAALVFALRRLAEHHERCALATQSRRIVAIKMYLDYGFVPDLTRTGAIDSWRAVKAQLTHPVLEALDALRADNPA
jgi:GNAT superfamily N-acetyltransferase